MKSFIPYLLLCITSCCLGQANILWEKEIGGGEDDWGYGLCLSDDGMYVFAGVTASYDEEVPDSIGGTDIWVGKMSPDSTLIWSYTYGGTSNDRANDIQKSFDGGYYFTGFTESIDVDITNNNGSKDLVISKLYPDGTIEWLQSFGGTSDEIGNTVIPLDDGGVIVAGTAFSDDGDVTNHIGSADFWVIRLDADGNIIWDNCFGGNMEDRARKIIKTQDGNFVILGTAFSQDGNVSNPLGGVDFWLIKINIDGQLIWERSLGGSSADQGSDLIETSDGNLIITGEVLSNNGDVDGNHGLTDAWVAKLDTNGNLIWQNALGGTMVDYFLSIKEADDGGFVATGNTFSDNGDVSINLGASDVWLVKLDANGNLLWEQSIGYDLNEIGNEILSVGEDIIIFGGIQVDHLRHGNSDAYIVKLRAPLNSIIPIHDALQLRVFPNPSSEWIHLSHDDIILDFQLFHSNGQLVKTYSIRQNQFSLNIQGVPLGEYFGIATLGNGQQVSIPIIITN